MRARVRVSLSVIAAPLTRLGRTMGRLSMELMRKVLGHSLVRSLVHSHHSLMSSLPLLASLARSVALIRSHAHSLSPEVMGKRYLI